MSRMLPEVRVRISNPVPPMYRVKVSAFKGDARGVPAIVNLLAESMKLTKEWQLFIRAINYNMPVEKVSALLDYQRAFTNFNGFGDPSDPRANYLLNEDLLSPLPKLDKVRTCVGAIHTGEVQNGYLWLEYMDGDALPPKALPESHPWLFFPCVNISGSGEIFPFSNGALYPWYKDGKTPVTWLPLVSRFPVRIALADVERVS